MQAKPFNRGAADGNQPAVTPEDALTRHGVDVNRIESADSSVAEVVASFGDTVFDAVHVGQDKNKTSYLIGEGPQADFPAPRLRELPRLV